jgi:hypothetical protein
MSSLFWVIFLDDEKWGTGINPQTIISLCHIFAQYFIDTQDSSSYTLTAYASEDGQPSKAFPRHVFAHTEWGEADGGILRLLQRLTGKKTDGRKHRR